MSSDQNLGTVEKLVGLVLIFMGFINVLLSISGNYPMELFPAITFLFGIIFFTHGSGQTWHKWIIIGMAATLGVVFLIRGEVGGKFTLAMFWGTILVILFYTFFAKDTDPHEDATHKGTGTGD